MKMRMRELYEKMKQHKKVVAAIIAIVVLAGIGGGAYVLQTPKGQETVQAKTTEKVQKEDLAKYVEGIKDLYVQVDAKNIDWMKDITYKKEKVSEVKADAAKVDLSKVGTYKLVYEIVGADKTEEKKTVNVEVVDSKTSQELAAKGKEVLNTDNQLVKATGEKKETDQKKDDVKKTDASTAQSKDNETSSSGKEKTAPAQQNTQQSNQSGGSQGNANAGGGDTTQTQTPAKEPVWHEPVYEQRWVVDQAAWDEVVSEPVYGMVELAICNACGADITADPGPHMKAHALAGENAGWHSEWISVQTGTNTYTVHHDEVGHYEQVLVQEGYWK